MEKETDVIFVKLDGEILAIFPREVWDNEGNVASYLHIGQHGACDPEHIFKQPLATFSEYEALKTELESIGYNLNVLYRNDFAELWLEFFNDFLTTDKFSEYHATTPKVMESLLNKGKEIYKQENN